MAYNVLTGMQSPYYSPLSQLLNLISPLVSQFCYGVNADARVGRGAFVVGGQFAVI